MKTETTSGDGIDIAYDQLGERPRALLLHAGGERRQVWHPVMRYLDEQGISSVTCDQRGHGDSGGSRTDGIVAYGADTARLVAHFGNRPVIVGASLGGFAAMLALVHEHVQSNVAGLVLVDVVPDPDPLRVRAYLSGEGRQDLGRSPLVDDILSRHVQMLTAVASLYIPVLLVRSGREAAITDEEVARLSLLVPQLQTAVIPDAGHLIARDAPLALASLIADFLRSGSVMARYAG